MIMINKKKKKYHCENFIYKLIINSLIQYYNKIIIILTKFILNVLIFVDFYHNIQTRSCHWTLSVWYRFNFTLIDN